MYLFICFLYRTDLKGGSSNTTVCGYEKCLKLLETRQTAFLYYWPIVLYARNLMLEYLSQPEREPELQVLRCHVGKKLIPGQKSAQLFFPPGGYRLKKIFDILSEAGILDWWHDECLGILQAKRVQDRNMYNSPIAFKTSYSENAQVKPLGMHGKVKCTFFLWLVGILFSVGVMSVEKCF